MKSSIALLLFAPVIAGLAGCSTVASRIDGHRQAFNSWPPAIQQRVRAGQVDIGFTPEQVQVALGSPDYTFRRVATNGSFEIWSYRDRKPRFSFGVGVGGGSYHHGGAYSTGVGLATGGGGYPDEKLRVTFDPYGRVVAVEQVRRGR